MPEQQLTARELADCFTGMCPSLEWRTNHVRRNRYQRAAEVSDRPTQ
jgi:hypothetical protein